MILLARISSTMVLFGTPIGVFYFVKTHKDFFHVHKKYYNIQNKLTSENKKKLTSFFFIMLVYFRIIDIMYFS